MDVKGKYHTPFILIESPMFWGTADKTGSDSREPNNVGQLCAQRQPVWTWLPASLLSEPFLTFTGNWKFKGEVRGKLFPMPPPVVSPFHLVNKVGGIADVFHFVLYQVTCWDKLLEFQPHWQNSFLPLSVFIWFVFKRMVTEGHLTLFVCLFIETTPMCQSLLPPFANKYITCLKVTLQE